MDSIINLDFLKIKGNKEGKNTLFKEDKDDSNVEFSNTFDVNQNKENQDNKNKVMNELLKDKEAEKINKEKVISESNQNLVSLAPVGNLSEEVHNSKLNESANKNTIRLMTSENPIKESPAKLKNNYNPIMESLNQSKNNDKKFLDNTKQSNSKENISFLTNININKKKNVSDDIFSNIQKHHKKRINSFFKNYINYKNKKSIKGNLRLVKLAIMSKIKSLQIKEQNSTKKEIFENDHLEKKNISIVNKDYKELNKSSNVTSSKESNLIFEKPHSPDEMNKTLRLSENNNTNKQFEFDRLKNILDIKSNDVNERLINLFEKNLKSGNNIFEIQIRPENLGKLQITIEMLGDNNVDINIKADNSSSIQLISENNNNLQKMLQNNGLNLNNFNLNNNNGKKFSHTQDKKDKNLNNDETDNKISEVDKNKSINNNLVYIKA